ncbi:MAG: ornithine carbamoyltransferase [Planctomycetaceae bacterium]
MKHLTTLYDLDRADIVEILETSAELKQKFLAGERPALLQGRMLAQLFDKPSLRTRVSFEAAMIQLGGGVTFFSSKEAGLQGRESLADVARVLGSYSDVIVMRTFSQSLIEDFARLCRCPVINGLSDDFHPCQALADVLTLREVFGDLKKKRLVYVGDGNNVAASLAIIAAQLKLSMTVCTPKDYALSDEFLVDLKKRIPSADIATSNDPKQAVANADVIYTDVWASMGQEAEADKRQQVFAPYQVNAELLAAAPRHCRFMHCLPARRGIEVTDDVMDSPHSIVFQQAENRMHLAKGLMVWLLQPKTA